MSKSSKRVVDTCQTLGLLFCQLLAGVTKKVKFSMANQYSYTFLEIAPLNPKFLHRYVPKITP